MKKSILLITMCAVFIPGVVQAQNFSSLFFNGNGARSAGMGNAFTAVSDDATGIAWNPAGLAMLKGPESTVVGRFAFGSSTVGGFADYGISSWDIDVRSWSQLNFVGFAVPLNFYKRKVAAGIAFRRINNLTLEEISTIRGTGPIVDGEAKIFDNTDGGLDAISTSLAVEVFKPVTIGATVNVLTGKQDTYRNFSVNGEFDPESVNKSNTNYSGFSFDLGLMLNPFEALSLGARFNMPYTLKSEPQGASSINIRFPIYYTLGAALKPMKSLTVSADLRLEPYTQIELDGKKINESNGDDLEDNVAVHIGAEWIMQLANRDLPIRIGYYQNSTKSETLLNPEKVFTAGAGIQWSNFIINGAVEYTLLDYKLNVPEIGMVDYSGKEFRITIGVMVHLLGA